MSIQEKPSHEAENARLRTEIAGLKSDRLHAEHVAFCDGLPGVWPAWREVVIANLDHLAALPVAVEFGEGDGKASLLDGFKAMLSNLPTPVQFAEFATNDRAELGAVTGFEFAAPAGCVVDPESMATHQKAMQHQKANGGTYEDAVTAVT